MISFKFDVEYHRSVPLVLFSARFLCNIIVAYGEELISDY
jgi:hypothetical protein